ncbi:hypothetical protein EPN27_03885, partial [Patescibacteria group bacterium]
MQDYRSRVRETWITQSKPVHIQGLEGGSVAYALQRLPLIDPDSQTLVICPSSKSAAQLASDIQAIAHADGQPPPVALFPAPDHLPYHPLTPSRDTWISRLTILQHWARRSPLCCVAPVAALLRRLPPTDIFMDYGESVSVGATIDPSKLQLQLAAMGYVASPLVEEPGDFSRRGGILDIWSITESAPSRIELEGDTIVSIRTFDPETQRSRGDLVTLSISPAHNLCFSNEDITAITRRLKNAADAADFPASRRRALVEALHNGRRTPIMETLLPCFYDRIATIADYLSPKSRVIIVDPAGVRAEAEEYLKTCATAYADTDEIDRIIPPDHLFSPWNDLRQDFPKAVCVLGGIAAEDGTELITVTTRNTTTRRMDSLEPLLSHVRDQGLSLTLTSHTPIQAERTVDMLRWQGAAPVIAQGP